MLTFILSPLPPPRGLPPGQALTVATLVLVAVAACEPEVTEKEPAPVPLGPEELCPQWCGASAAGSEEWCYERFEGPPECDAFAQKFIECEASVECDGDNPKFYECNIGRAENGLCMLAGCGPATCGSLEEGCPCSLECDVGQITSECVKGADGNYECTCYLDGEAVCGSLPGPSLTSCNSALSGCSIYFANGEC